MSRFSWFFVCLLAVLLFGSLSAVQPAVANPDPPLYGQFRNESSVEILIWRDTGNGTEWRRLPPGYETDPSEDWDFGTPDLNPPPPGGYRPWIKIAYLEFPVREVGYYDPGILGGTGFGDFYYGLLDLYTVTPYTGNTPDDFGPPGVNPQPADVPELEPGRRAPNGTNWDPVDPSDFGDDPPPPMGGL